MTMMLEDHRCITVVPVYVHVAIECDWAASRRAPEGIEACEGGIYICI